MSKNQCEVSVDNKTNENVQQQPATICRPTNEVGWADDLFDGYDDILESTKKDANDSFRDIRMKILWILHNYYIKG